jgi:hypothetical protein
LRIGSTLVMLSRGLPVGLFKVIMSLHPTYISSNAVVLSFRLQNDNPST